LKKLVNACELLCHGSRSVILKAHRQLIIKPN
jgi:hypothetical protein